MIPYHPIYCEDLAPKESIRFPSGILTTANIIIPTANGKLSASSLAVHDSFGIRDGVKVVPFCI